MMLWEDQMIPYTLKRLEHGVCFVRMNRLVYYYLIKFIVRFPYQYEVCQESLSFYLIKGKTLTTIDILVMEDSLHWLCSIIFISTFLFFILTKFVLVFKSSAIGVELSLPWKIGESPEECAANYSQHNIFSQQLQLSIDLHIFQFVEEFKRYRCIIFSFIYVIFAEIDQTISLFL